MLQTFLHNMNNSYDNLETLLSEQLETQQNPLTWLHENREPIEKYIFFCTNPLGGHFSFESDMDLNIAHKDTWDRHVQFMNMFYSHFRR